MYDLMSSWKVPRVMGYHSNRIDCWNFYDASIYTMKNSTHDMSLRHATAMPDFVPSPVQLHVVPVVVENRHDNRGVGRCFEMGGGWGEAAKGREKKGVRGEGALPRKIFGKWTPKSLILGCFKKDEARSRSLIQWYKS